MHRNIKILIAEPSVILRSGLAIVLKRVSQFHVQVSETASLELLHGFIKSQKPDLLIINPIYWGSVEPRRIKSEVDSKELKCVAFLTTQIADTLLTQFDEVITIHDSQDTIVKKIEKLFTIGSTNESVIGSDVLSAREKEVLVCLVKGLTNKEIGNELFLSTHTVISHRRNITRKLEIHSTAGLTVYAIMNKLIEIDEINNLKGSE